MLGRRRQGASAWLLLLAFLPAGSFASAAQTGTPRPLSHAVAGSLSAQDFDGLLRQGFALHRQGQFAQAIPLLRQAQQMRPQDYFANLLLGIDELRAGHPDRAVTKLQAAHRARPREAMASGYLAEAWTALHQYGHAAALLQTAARQESGDQQAALTLVEFELERFAALSTELRSSRRGLAFAYVLQARAQPAQQQAAALQALQHAAAVVPDLPGLASALGQVEFSLGQTSAAAQAWAQALRRQPNDLDAWMGQAQLAARRHDLASAQKLVDRVAAHSPHRLEQALATWPDGLSVPSTVASSARPAQLFFSCLERRGSPQSCPQGFLEGQIRKGISPRVTALSRRQLFEQQDWERVARIRPAASAGSAQASFERGVALAHLDRCASAIPELEDARADAALRAEADFYLSRCYAEDAGAVVAVRLQGVRQGEFAHEVRGDILLRLGNNSAGAVGEYRQALAVVPSDPALWARLAEAERAAGHPDEAATAAHRALQIDPLRWEAMRTLAQIAFEQKKYASAIPWLQKIVLREPDDLEAQTELGTALARQGQPQAAVSLLQHALQAGYPDERGALHFLLGTVLRQLGHAQAARQAFQKAQQLSDAFSNRAQAPDQAPHQVPHDAAQ